MRLFLFLILLITLGYGAFTRADSNRKGSWEISVAHFFVQTQHQGDGVLWWWDVPGYAGHIGISATWSKKKLGYAGWVWTHPWYAGTGFGLCYTLYEAGIYSIRPMVSANLLLLRTTHAGGWNKLNPTGLFLVQNRLRVLKSTKINLYTAGSVGIALAEVWDDEGFNGKFYGMHNSPYYDQEFPVKYRTSESYINPIQSIWHFGLGISCTWR